MPAETEPQVLSDSAMMAQYAIDSAQSASGTGVLPSGNGTQHTAAGDQTDSRSGAARRAEAADAQKPGIKNAADAVAAATQVEEKKKAGTAEAKKKTEEKKNADAAAIKKAEEKKKTEAVAAKKLAEEKKKAEAVAAKKLVEEKTKAEAAEAKKKMEEKKIADAAATAKKAEEKKKIEMAEALKAAEKKKLADAERKNMSYVEVPGYTPRHPTSVVEAKPLQRAVAPEKKPAVIQEPAPRTAVQQKIVKNTAAAAAPEQRSEAQRTTVQKRMTAQDSVKKSPARPAAPKMAAVKAPAAKTLAAKAPADSAAGRTMGEGKYSVQISSWADEARAMAQARQYTAAGIQAFVSQDGRIYRVCIGRFATRNAALARAEELTPMLETKYKIIQVK